MVQYSIYITFADKTEVLNRETTPPDKIIDCVIATNIVSESILYNKHGVGIYTLKAVDKHLNYRIFKVDISNHNTTCEDIG